jgi:genome maintenance exonuclease 1
MIKLNKKFYYPTSTRKIIDGKRHYLVGDEKLPSVTSILKACESEEKKASLDAWRQRVGEDEATRITDNAASRGTLMHTILEGHILNRPVIDLTPEGQLATKMARQIVDQGLKDRLEELWATECVLFYPDMYAGATDGVGIYEGKEAIIDFKQTNKPKRKEWIEDYFLQLAAYAIAHNQIYQTNIQFDRSRTALHLGGLLCIRFLKGIC